MRSREEQQAIRQDVFRWLDELMFAGTYEFSRAELINYRFRGERIPLLDQARGIRNPADFASTLSIMTSAKNHGYDDEIRPDGLVRYSYQSKDGGDNVKLRNAYAEGEPLVYFHGVRDGYYVAYYPVYIVHDDPDARQVHIALDETLRFFGDPLAPTPDERRYAERVVRQRLHQPMFRARVLRAYDATCAVCSLKHAELLDAAHIVADGDLSGLARITNGLALCKIHHASYDRNLLGITPDYEVRIDRDLLDEIDGPMLRHGLQDMHGRTLALPKRKVDWPSRERLSERFEGFAA
ncbi:HNH endonuclease [Agromyces endophyticus]|uniref:HNH endonuclease n=1 Tax=Agromyces sp. H17E-10 TaxID=2932244 RepID=UPI001FD54692|nr:HNH endonuclease [Agromyces sp. H17E-10]UOQ88050.1 HNH endonuclease [Agromyces sp. H17E-10]